MTSESRKEKVSWRSGKRSLRTAIEVSDEEDPSSLALRLLEQEWETIEKQKDVYLPKLIDLGGDLISETALDELAKRVKESFGNKHLSVQVRRDKEKA